MGDAMSKLVPRNEQQISLSALDVGVTGQRVTPSQCRTEVARLLAAHPDLVTADNVTEIQAVTKKRGRPVTGNAKSVSERVKAWRIRKRSQRLAG